VFSFHPVKHIACGEGGMITTNHEELYHRIRSLRTHGIQQRSELCQYNHGIWYYELQELGYNYRLTDIQAALGISQLKRAKAGLERRKEIAAIYEQAFKNKFFIIGQSGLVEGHAYHLYVIECMKRDDLINYLRSKNIFAQVHYIPLHLMPYYRNFGWKEGELPKAEMYYSKCLSIPIYPTLMPEEQEYVINTINNFYE